MTWFDYVTLGLFLTVQVQLRRLDRESKKLFLRNEERSNNLSRIIDSLTMRCNALDDRLRAAEGKL